MADKPTPSDSLIELLKKHESFRASPYDDGAGNQTIGYGHRITDGAWKNFDENKDGKLDKQEAEALLRLDASKHQRFQNKLKVDVAPEVADALGSLEYNLGSNNKNLRTIVDAINEGRDAVEISGMVMDLTKARDKRTGEVKELGGLKPRRKEEARLISDGLNQGGPAEQQLPARQQNPQPKRGIIDTIAGAILPQAQAETMDKPSVDSVLQELNQPAQAGSTQPGQAMDVDSVLNELSNDPNAPGKSPDNPAPESGLDFSTRMALAIAQDPKSKMNLLQEEFGRDNVKMSDQGLLVNDGKHWFKAESGLLTELAATSPEMAGGMIGGVVGGVAGAASPVPGGAVIGRYLGSAAGSAIAHAIKNYGAEKVGIKTEQDAGAVASQLSADMVMNLAFDVALSNPVVRNTAIAAGTAGAAYGALTAEPGEKKDKALAYGAGAALLAGGAAATGVAAKYVAKGGMSKDLAKVWSTGLRAVSEDVAQNAEMMARVTGGNPEDYATLLRSKDDAVAIKSALEEDLAYAKKKMINPDSVSPVAPSMEKMINGTKALMQKSKKAALDSFGAARDAIETSKAVANKTFDFTKVGANFRSELNAAGVLEADPAGGFKIARDASTENIPRIFSEDSLAVLNTILQKMEAVTGKTFAKGGLLDASGKPLVKNARTELTFKEAKNLLSGIDDLLESTGHYAGGDMAVSSNTRRILQGLRKSINDEIATNLKDIPVEFNGQKVMANDLYKQAAEKYSAFRSLYDDFALTSRFGDPKNIPGTVDKMLKSRGDSVEKAFGDMLKSVDIQAGPELARLQQLRAAGNMSNSIHKATGFTSVMKSKLGVNPRDMTMAAANQMISKITPVSPQSSLLTESVARGHQFVNGLTRAEKQAMVSTPALRTFLQTVYGVNEVYDQTQSDLMGQ